MDAPPPESAEPSSVYSLLVRRPIATLMASVAAVVFGLVSYTNLPLNLMPDLSYPTLTVRTEFPGAAPGEVETQVSRPLEESLSTVPGLVRLQSISRAGASDVILEFAWDASMGEVSQAVRERLGLMSLPDAARRPLVLRYDPNLDPILSMALSAAPGQDGEEALVELRRVADEEVRRTLETLPGVAAVKVRGGLEREVTVQVDEGLLHARGFTLNNLVERLRAENINLAGGSLLEGQTEYLIRTLNEFRGAQELADLILVGEDGRLARLGDLAEIVVRPKEREIVGRVGGREAVEISVYREADANIVAVSRRVQDKVFGSDTQHAWLAAKAKEAEAAKAKEAEAAAGDAAGKDGKGKTGKGKGKAGKGKAGKGKGKGKAGKGKGKRGGRGGGGGGEKMTERVMTNFLVKKVPDGMSFQVVSDQARFIEASIADVRDTALFGALLAVLVLFAFLRHGWSTAIISSAIPASVVVTFAPMYLFGVSLNLMSLGGLALAIGMLVDNSIVVLESIARCREEGDSVVGAAVRGTREVAGAVTASTLTTVAVFFPIAFVTGVAGQLFGHLALTVVFGLLASLAVALLDIPVLSALPDRAQVRAADDTVGPARPGEDDGWRTLRLLGPGRALLNSLAGIPAFATGGRAWLRPLRWLLVPLWVVFALVRMLATWLLIIPVWLGLRFGAVVLWVGRRVLGLLGRVGGVFSRPVGRAFDRGYDALEAGYQRLLRASVRAPSLVLLPAVVLFAGAMHLGSGLGTELLPEVHQGVIEARLSLPVGTPLERTLEAVDALERGLRRDKRIKSLYTAAGADRDAAEASSDSGEHSADMTIRLNASLDTAALEAAVGKKIRKLATAIPELEVELGRPALFSFRTPLEVEVRGDDLNELLRLADAAVVRLSALPGLKDVQSNLRAGFPEIQIRYDRERLARYQLDLAAVAAAVRDKVAGNIATDLRGRGRRTEVRVVLREQDRSTIEDLRRLNVNPRGIPPIALEAVADLTLAEGPSQIRRSDQERSALITANLEGFDLGTAAAGVEAALRDLPGDSDVTFEVGGQSREMEESLSSLQFALLLAIFLVYVIMASQFESIVQPLIILLSLPLAGVGLVAALMLTGTPISVVVLIGAIVLAGVVVNNAIVLVDYANQLQERGRSPLEAIVEAGRVRLRPIIISTLTTVLGLLPMAIGGGEGSEIRQPLALTIIAGLSSSTLLTLVVIPVLYSVLARLRRVGGAP